MRDVKSKPVGRHRALAHSAPLVALGLAVYWGCTPDFDALNGGEENGGQTSGGTAGIDTGGTPGGGVPPCTDTECGGTPPVLGGSGGSGGPDPEPVGGSGGTVDPPEGGQGGAGGVIVPSPVAQYDFETGVQAWVGVDAPSPPNYIDAVQVSDAAAHDGTQSLSLVIDGIHDTIPPGTSYFGALVGAAVPSNTEISFWIMSTLPGFSIETFVQLSPAYTWVPLTDPLVTPLTQDVWREIRITTPPDPILRFGMKLYSPMDATAGAVYIDQVTW